MTMTLDQRIAALEDAAASGALRIESNGELIVYRSMADLMKALDYFTTQRAAASGGPAATSVSVAVFGCD